MKYLLLRHEHRRPLRREMEHGVCHPMLRPLLQESQRRSLESESWRPGLPLVHQYQNRCLLQTTEMKTKRREAGLSVTGAKWRRTEKKKDHRPRHVQGALD